MRFPQRRPRRRRKDESPYQLGLNALIAGNPEAAMKHLAEAVREDPRNIDAYVKLGDLLRERGQIRQAIQVHRELLVKRKLPKNLRTEITKSLTLDLAQAENWPETIASIRSLPRGERGDPRVLRLARDAYEGLGDNEKAVATHKELLKTGESAGEPTLGIYRAHLALQTYKRGDSDRARGDFRAAIKDDPAAAVAYVYLGDIAAADGDSERAIAYWMKVVSGKPECAHLVFGRLEKAYFEAGDYGRMMGVYEDVTSRAPTNVQALTGLSRMLERKGTIDEAIRVAHEAVKHEGDTLAGHRQLIEILVRNERYEEAARTAEALLAKRDSSPETLSCQSCGQTIAGAIWRCPSCGTWTDVC